MTRFTVIINPQCEVYFSVLVFGFKPIDTNCLEGLGFYFFTSRWSPESGALTVIIDSCFIHTILIFTMQALEALNKKDITEIKSYGKPPVLVERVMEAIMILKGTTDLSWAEAKRQLGKIGTSTSKLTPHLLCTTCLFIYPVLSTCSNPCICFT